MITQPDSNFLSPVCRVMVGSNPTPPKPTAAQKNIKPGESNCVKWKGLDWTNRPGLSPSLSLASCTPGMPLSLTIKSPDLENASQNGAHTANMETGHVVWEVVNLRNGSVPASLSMFL